MASEVSFDDVVVGFVHALRRAGLDVPVKSTVLFGEALDAVGLGRPSNVYWAGRATLVHRHEDIATYDRVFDAYWRGRRVTGVAVAQTVPVTVVFDSDDADAATHDDQEDDEAEVEGETVLVRYSATEVLQAKDFALYTADELAEAQRLMADLRLAGALRRSRRLRSTRRARGHPDVRRTVRASTRTSGEPVRRLHREPGARPRRVVLLCDISGSMEPYIRALLRFVHAAVAARTRVEAFALGTRLTRLTRELSQRDPDAALARAGDAVEDWSGGTRLGESLRRFNDEWGVRGMARGAVVVIVSDGWDRGDPEQLATEMARLHRVAYRVVWVNPLKASPGYQPLAQGMAAALPYVDEFVEGHSLDALDELTAVVARA